MAVRDEVISFGAWGGSGGDPWSSLATNGIAQITINEDIYNIKSFSFKDANGSTSGTFGERNPDPNAHGVQRKINIHWPSEYLISISGTYGEYHGLHVILSISFITNLATYGPFGGRNSGQAFSIPITNSVIVGFFGRSGYYLDAIGVHVQPMNPRGSVLVGPWGGSGGDSFKFKVDPIATYIKQILVSHRENIKSISFKDADHNEYGPFGGHDPNDNGKKAVIEIENTQRLTSINGTYGNFNGLMVITSLSFVINDIINGPYGTETGTSFSIPIKGSELVGFFGKSGWYLDSIGLYVKPRASSDASVAKEI